jgi:hypothetical protein
MGTAAMTYKLVYGAVREHPRKFIHMLCVVDAFIDTDELEELTDRMRDRALTRQGEPNAAVVVVQGDSKETLRLHG